MAREQTIPVVDLRDFTEGDEAAREAFIQKLGAALADLGFVAVEGHGIDKPLLDETYQAFEDFFGLETDIKQKYEDPENGRQRGYTSFGVERAKDNAKPDLKEFYHVGRELDADHALYARSPKNLWPDEMPELKTKAMALYDSMEHCAMNLLRAFSIYLDQPADFLPEMATDGTSIIRVIHYPVCDGFDEPGKMRAAQHEDINLMTILPEATQSGLELLTREGEWLPIHAIPGQVIVDTGDMMKRLTNGTIPATTHRVVNPTGQAKPRYSMPFFVHPYPDASLEVLESCVPEGEEPKYTPITAEEFLFERLRENGVK